jgi:hypothetical protein
MVASDSGKPGLQSFQTLLSWRHWGLDSAGAILQHPTGANSERYASVKQWRGSNDAQRTLQLLALAIPIALWRYLSTSLIILSLSNIQRPPTSTRVPNSSSIVITHRHQNIKSQLCYIQTHSSSRFAQHLLFQSLYWYSIIANCQRRNVRRSQITPISARNFHHHHQDVWKLPSIQHWGWCSIHHCDERFSQRVRSSSLLTWRIQSNGSAIDMKTLTQSLIPEKLLLSDHSAW